MRVLFLSGVALLAACREAPVPGDAPNVPAATPGPGRTGAVQVARWDMQSSGEGAALALLSPSGATILRLFCARGGDQLLVNVPAFQAIGSEERLSFGGGGNAVTFVADSAGDRQRGGVSATGGIPADLPELLSGAVSASYGAQNSGPHPAPPADQARAFAAACTTDGVQRPAPELAHPCQAQDNKPLPPMHLKAIGTEPFWAARIEGRCVTYSHPEDQKGTRVWTRFGGSAEQGSWTGSLEGRPFLLRTRPQAGCSDGMSDRRYPIAVNLTVGGEQRSGCAERL